MKKTLYFASYLMLLGMAVTLIAYLGYNFTQPYIKRNLEKKIDEAVALLYNPDEGYKRNPNQETNRYREAEEKSIDGIYEVLDENDNLVAVIYDVKASGRNGMVHALISVDPYTDTVTGLVFYSHTETPGKGELYMISPEVDKLIGQEIDDVVVDKIAGVSSTWNAIVEMFSEISTHYALREVHIDG